MSIKHAILGVLRDGPMHGYQITGELEQRIGGGRYNGAQVYQGLYTLASQGFVTAAETIPGAGRDRRPFTITPKGVREFDRWIKQPFLPSRPARDDAVVKLVFLGREDAARLIAMLERLRRQHLRRLTASRLDDAPNAPEHLGAALFAELSAAALRFREEAELRWIDHCLLRIRPLLPDDLQAPEDLARDNADQRDEAQPRRSSAPRS